MIIQLNPTLPVFIISKNVTGYALAIIDYSQEHDLMFLVATDDTGELWCIPNKDLRVQKNYSVGRDLQNTASLGNSIEVQLEEQRKLIDCMEVQMQNIGVNISRNDNITYKKIEELKNKIQILDNTMSGYADELSTNYDNCVKSIEDIGTEINSLRASS